MSADTATIVLVTPIREGFGKAEYRPAVYTLSQVEDLERDPSEVVRVFGKARVFTKRGSALCYGIDKDGGQTEYGMREIRLSKPFSVYVDAALQSYRAQLIEDARDPIPHRTTRRRRR